MSSWAFKGNSFFCLLGLISGLGFFLVVTHICASISYTYTRHAHTYNYARGRSFCDYLLYVVVGTGGLMRFYWYRGSITVKTIPSLSNYTTRWRIPAQCKNADNVATSRIVFCVRGGKDSNPREGVMAKQRRQLSCW